MLEHIQFFQQVRPQRLQGQGQIVLATAFEQIVGTETEIGLLGTGTMFSTLHQRFAQAGNEGRKLLVDSARRHRYQALQDFGLARW